MGNGIPAGASQNTAKLYGVSIVCPKENAAKNSGVHGKIKTFDINFDLSRSYGETAVCPHCGEEVTIRVKTKGDATQDSRTVVAELKKLARNSIIILAASSALILAMILLRVFAGGGVIEGFTNVLIFISALIWIAGLIYTAAYSKYLGSPEKAIEIYERSHPYAAYIINSEHYFMDGGERSSKKLRRKTMVWDIPDTDTADKQ